MSKIDDITKDKIKRSARIVDVMQQCGIELRRKGANYECLCPFHEDRHFGNFAVNARDNYYKCFSCGASGDPIKFLMEYEKMTYPDALRYIAAMYGIYIDDEPAPKVVKREPRQPLPPRKWVIWNIDIVKPYMHHTEDNVLLTWMLNLPMGDDHLHNLRNMIELYFVGTSLKGNTAGWVIWPQVDMEMRVRDMKFMAYKPDGHRDKNRPAPWDASKTYSTTWMKAMLVRAGQFDEDKCEVHHCLFGLHLAKFFPHAEVCLVESEKTALICSAFSDPHKKIWMACGGLRFFTTDMLEPLIKDNRYVVVYPDVDGAQSWSEAIKAIGYKNMSMTAKMRPIDKGGLYNPMLDEPKADIADIMIRLMHGIEETPAEVAARRLGSPESAKDLAHMIEKLDLQLD